MHHCRSSQRSVHHVLSVCPRVHVSTVCLLSVCVVCGTKSQSSHCLLFLSNEISLENWVELQSWLFVFTIPKLFISIIDWFIFSWSLTIRLWFSGSCGDQPMSCTICQPWTAAGFQSLNLGHTNSGINILLWQCWLWVFFTSNIPMYNHYLCTVGARFLLRLGTLRYLWLLKTTVRNIPNLTLAAWSQKAKQQHCPKFTSQVWGEVFLTMNAPKVNRSLFVGRNVPQCGFTVPLTDLKGVKHNTELLCRGFSSNCYLWYILLILKHDHRSLTWAFRASCWDHLLLNRLILME